MPEEMSVSEMMAEGTLCERCGVYDNWGVGDDFPRLCSHCAQDMRKRGHAVVILPILGGYQHICAGDNCPPKKGSK